MRPGPFDLWSRRQRLVPSARTSCRRRADPEDDREVPGPGEQEGARQRAQGYSRSAVKHDENRIVSILTTNADPLVDAADVREERLIDAARRIDRGRFRYLPVSICSI